MSENLSRATLGFICLPTDLMADKEVPLVLSQVPGVAWRLQKVKMCGDTINEDAYQSVREHLFDAADTLRPQNSVSAIALACTSLSFTLRGDDVYESLQRAHPQANVTNMASAVVDALKFIQAKRLAVLSPYESGLAEANENMLAKAGFTVVQSINLGLSNDQEISSLSQQSISDYLEVLVEQSEDVDTIFLACSAFQTLTPRFIDGLERKFDKTVVTSMQALLWRLLQISEIDDPVYGFGQLLRIKRLHSSSIISNTKQILEPKAPPPFEDVYPSRVANTRAKLLPRVDPVIDKNSLGSGPLTPQQMLDFDRDGAIVLPSVFGFEELAILKKSIMGVRDYYETLGQEEVDLSTRLVSEKSVGGVSVDKKIILKSIWEVHKNTDDAQHLRDAGPVLFTLARDARLVGAAQQILGEDVYIHQSRINFQQGYSEVNPLGGTGFLWHQDFEQWHSDDGMPRMRAISMAILLDRNTEANAALMIMPGTHRYFLQAEPYSQENSTKGEAALRLKTGPILGDHILPNLANKYGIRYCKGEPGDVVVFDCATLHGSHTNISPWPRQNVFFVYNAVSNILNPEGGYDDKALVRPEHIACRSEKYMGVPLKPIKQIEINQ